MAATELGLGLKRIWARCGGRRSGHEADLGVEIAADDEVLKLDAVPIAVVLDLGQVAPIVAGEPRRPALREVGIEEQVLEKGEVGVDADELARAVAVEGHGSVREDDSDVASSEKVPPQTNDGEVRRLDPDGGLLSRLDVEKSDGVSARASRQPSSGADRYLLPSAMPIRRLKNMIGV